MKILFFIAMHGRHDVVRLCFANLKKLQSRFDLSVFVVCSSVEDSKLCAEFGWDWTIEDNYPLGRKLNLGLAEAMNHDFTHLIQLGSDDIITEELLSEYLKYPQLNYFGVNRFIMVDKTGRRAKEWIYGMEIAPINHPIGAGRVFSREALIDVLNRTELWENERNRVLDGDSDMTMIENGYRAAIIPFKGVGIVDIKDKSNIWPYDECQGKEIEYSKIEELVS